MDLFIQLLINGVINGSHYALLAIGFGLIFGTTNLVHFAFGPVYASGAYGAWVAAALLGWPLIPAAGAGIAAAALIGVASYLFLYRPFELQRAPVFVVLVASLGASIVLENVLGMIFGTDIKVVPTPPEGVLLLGDFVLTSVQMMQVGALVAVSVLLAAFFKLTRYGKAVLAMTDDPEMARVIGIDTVKVSVIVFAIGSAVAAIAAVLILFKDGAQPSMGFAAVFIAFVAVVVGGIGSIRGAVLGGYLLGIAENVGMMKIPTEWQSSIAFVVLFLVLVFRPSGLFKGN